jgi:protoporphyrin/coproporphyrin ferrochelatase
MAEKAILLMNLGSPDSPETKDLKPYLSQFLMDERVIDVNKWLRAFLVKGIIVPFRSPKSAAKYKTIWTDDGSPLVAITKKVTDLVRRQSSSAVYYSMRYGNPSTEKVLKQIHEDNPDLKEITALPLYPHYAMSSYETAAVQVEELHEAAKYSSTLNIVPPFYNNGGYVNALSSSIEPYLINTFDHILFSYHGIPERHVKKTDCTHNHCLQSTDCCEVSSPAHAFCYRHQVITTTDLVAQKLNIDKSKYSFSFQSRLGRDEWLKPYTAKLLGELPAKGIKKLVVVCPAFVSDCLETLEEMGEEGREIFLKAGGESFTLIPCMNTNPLWINTIVNLCENVKVKSHAGI